MRELVLSDPNEIHLVEKFREILAKRPRVGDLIGRSWSMPGFEGDEPYLVSVDVKLQPTEGLVKPSEGQLRVERKAVEKGGYLAVLTD